ncbi:MAG: hypothetical protein MEQ07_06765 [Aquimonas sp.]|nr:hypothetical protein [Aquimonas sp.]
MRHTILIALLSTGLLAAPGAVTAETLRLPALDLPKLAAEDLAEEGKTGRPLRYGLVHAFKGSALPGLEGRGSWSSPSPGQLRWTLTLDAPQASNLALAFDALRLPAGAELRLFRADDKQPALVYTDADNPVDGQLRTPLIEGASVRLQLDLPEHLRDHARLRLVEAVRGYRDPLLAIAQAKSGSCNIDIACPQGDAWREQSRSVAHYTFNSGAGSFVCTGQLVATGSQTQDLAQPRFLTAQHCLSTASAAASMTFYWRYESPTCRTPGSAASGIPLPSNSNSAAIQSGATLLAAHQPTDFTMVQLNSPVPAAANAFWSGWDRRNSAPIGAVGIHHPAGHEKRIAIDLDPLTRSGSCIVSGTEDTHWRVGAWEQGTTEQGSSGSGLWRSDSRRLIGVLSGGQASCTNPTGFDCYGALDRGWTGGGASTSRMSDWMTRGGGSPEVQDGHAGCSAPSVNLQAPGAGARVGEPLNFSVGASGGAGGPYRIDWDLDGDGQFERQQGPASVSVRFAQAFSGQVRVRVADSAGCASITSRALDVLAPQLSATAGSPAQVCGDGDAALEPGERWRLPVTLSNSGSAALPAGAHALFANGTAELPGLDSGPNAFGYRAGSSAGGACAYAFADIGGAAALALTDADDGRSSEITLGGSGVRLFGQTYTRAIMSTNGYIAFDPADDGAQFRNFCDGGFNAAGRGPRLYPLHQDWVVRAGGALRYAYQATCARPAEAGGAQPCHVFQWDGLRRFNGPAAEDASFQTIVYANSGQVAYQYRRADGGSGGEATIGLNNAAQNDPLIARCNASNAAPAQSAICIFDPASLPAGASALLETPTQSLPALAVGASATVQLEFQVPAGTSCGAALALDLLGVAGEGFGSFNPQPLLRTRIAEACQAATSCSAPAARALPRVGFFSEPARPGNGLAAFTYGSASDPVLGAIWYTADALHSSDWYTFAGPARRGLLETELIRTRNLGPAFSPQSTPTGRAWLGSIDAQTQLFAWRFDDGRRGIERLRSTAAGLSYAQPNHTNAWIQPGQEGWGLAIEGIVTPGGPLEFFGAYVFDSSGQSRWATGTSNTTSSGSVALTAQRAHCPGCPFYADWDTRGQPAGSLQRSYTSCTRAQFSSTISLPAPLSGSWNRSTTEIQALGDQCR